VRVCAAGRTKDAERGGGVGVRRDALERWKALGDRRGGVDARAVVAVLRNAQRVRDGAEAPSGDRHCAQFVLEAELKAQVRARREHFEVRKGHVRAARRVPRREVPARAREAVRHIPRRRGARGVRGRVTDEGHGDVEARARDLCERRAALRGEEAHRIALDGAV